MTNISQNFAFSALNSFEANKPFDNNDDDILIIFNTLTYFM